MSYDMQVLVWGRQKGVKPVSGIPKNGYPMAYTDIYNKKKKPTLHRFASAYNTNTKLLNRLL
jgi:hypothetical protein